MKKMFLSIVLLCGAILLSSNVSAQSVNALKSVNFCGIVDSQPTNDVWNINIKKQSSTCEITAIANDGYTIEDGVGSVELKEGDNVHYINVKDANGNLVKYTFNIKLNSSSENGNPNTGDNTLVYITTSICVIAIGALSYNRIKKYSENN